MGKITFNWDRWVLLLVFGSSALIFLPLSVWLVEYTLSHDQLLHAFLVLGFTGALLIIHRRLSLKPVWVFGRLSQNLLIVAYVLLFAAWFSHNPFVFLLAYCIAITSVLIFVFGESKARVVGSIMAAFTLFVGLALLLPVFDWPMRALAGEWAAVSLPWIGLHTELGLYRGGAEPMLILIANGKPFHVAAECNGFGLFSSSLLMALILMLYRRGSWLSKAPWMVVAAFMGLVFNYLRIVVIILLAPIVGSGNYMLMHEIVGTLATYGCLGLLWFLLVSVRLGGRTLDAS
jgi:exosortase/archaeosortase family protein